MRDPTHKEMEERAKVALELRHLLEQYPDAFACWVRRLQSAGERWQSQLPKAPKGRGGRVPKHSRFFQVSLLAGYWARPTGQKRRAWCEEVAASGRAGAFAFSTYSTRRFATHHAVESALKAAEALAGSDDEFRAEALTLRDDMRELFADADAKEQSRTDLRPKGVADKGR